MSAGWTNYSVGNGSQAGEDDGPVSVGGDTPACVSCKQRKLRCSRETPSCSHCLRLSSECVYQPKNKPGLKPGAVEALTRRVAFLEKILLDDAGNIRPRYRDHDTLANGHVVAHESPGAVKERAPRVEEHAPYVAPTPDYSHIHQSAEDGSRGSEEGNGVSNPLKRRFEMPIAESWLFPFEDVDIAQHLPSQPLLEKVADFFCISFHHWIPYIHKARLQTRVRQGCQDPGHVLVLHALVAVALRHMDPDVLYLDNDQILQQTRVSRMIVETHAMRNVTIESLQALIFLVFDLLNDGQTQRAWPLIGSLTRTIDYLQLTTEPSTSQSGSLMTPVRLVKPSNDWTELEERRRLFWIIFLLDRYCSVSTGWNTSLTADDVHRRLPADGGFFTREEPVTTPYFGIWNKAAARIGRSLANVPAQYNEEDPAVEHLPPGASPNSANGYIDASKLGAFAYCVEATESLSQVTTFFLQQRINWQDKEHAVSWLTRFKELDLRLVQWKIFLPPRWKDSNISSDRTVVDMDPNLTLAHITHNTSMILLHHPIGYPPRGWNDFVALPKECSAQTCELAAVETSNIVDKFLTHTPIPFVNVQFSFCAFIAAKALLFEHQATRKPLRSEFDRLIHNLEEMSARWKGKKSNDAKPTNQAGIYASHLIRLLEACQNDANFRFDFYDHNGLTLDPQNYASPTYAATPQARSRSLAHERSLMRSHGRTNSFTSSHSTLSPRRIPPPDITRNTTVPSPSNYEQHNPRLPITHAISPSGQPPPPIYASPQVPASYSSHTPLQQYQQPGNGVPVSGPSLAPYGNTGATGNQHSTQDQSLLNLSDAFMDSHFLDMDRVITFEDANFFIPGDAFRWQ
ncbi:hypothetical protein J4E93_005523 [Alternaria ventricosa]|uniref:uncharacterized protein n=1 Tax=Alternaria ventricosa TaxID=1187951 RepID=UPI0020C3DCB3|nr:uncharacterized protein J4E93_005523 [Alternaria ventricosa]KAI4645944.1 hypothetical protein J4E93_005523 [Alternaria ventricosa]